MSYGCFLFFFFFQAEDGIRDLYVTGVQTCALPIYQSKLFNGDVGVILPDAVTGELRAWFLGAADNALRGLAPGRLPEHETVFAMRSEERRVGKECRCRGAPER